MHVVFTKDRDWDGDGSPMQRPDGPKDWELAERSSSGPLLPTKATDPKKEEPKQ